MENVQAVINQLRESSDMESLYKVDVFHGYLEAAGKVVVEIRDQGEDDELRYVVHARTLDLPGQQKVTTSNPAETVAEAITGTRWFELSQ